jgi:glycosyltransferase involved in cell wall biosynthesis
MRNRLKILVSAYACSPYQGSEPGVGWGFVSRLARDYDLWVIVEEEKFRDDIERYCDEHPQFSQSVNFLFLRKRRNRLLRKFWPPSYYWYYRQWHRDALRLAEKLHAEISFDLAHQLTMVGFREPGYLWKLGIPFVWGPVGGMGLFPWRFLGSIGIRGALYYLGYNLFNLMHMNFLQRPRKAAQTAGVGLFMATPGDCAGAKHYWRCPSIVISEVGLPRTPVAEIRERQQHEPLRIVWSGQHKPGKALGLALSALEKLSPDVNWQIDILGEGPETAKWKEQAKKFGIQDRCHFRGWLPRDQALEIMSMGHLLLITSLRDLTSTVTIEALAFGLPIVSLDHCGFAYVVDDNCGVKIPVTNPRQVANDISQAIDKLARNEDLRRKLARGALCRATDFSWERKAEQVNGIYYKVLGNR